MIFSCLPLPLSSLLSAGPPCTHSPLPAFSCWLHLHFLSSPVGISFICVTSAVTCALLTLESLSCPDCTLDTYPRLPKSQHLKVPSFTHPKPHSDIPQTLPWSAVSTHRMALPPLPPCPVRKFTVAFESSHLSVHIEPGESYLPLPSLIASSNQLFICNSMTRCHLLSRSPALPTFPGFIISHLDCCPRLFVLPAPCISILSL